MTNPLSLSLPSPLSPPPSSAIHVAGFSTEHHNELLQLLLPEKLLADDKQVNLLAHHSL